MEVQPNLWWIFNAVRALQEEVSGLASSLRSTERRIARLESVTFTPSVSQPQSPTSTRIVSGSSGLRTFTSHARSYLEANYPVSVNASMYEKKPIPSQTLSEETQPVKESRSEFTITDDTHTLSQGLSLQEEKSQLIPNEKHVPSGIQVCGDIQPHLKPVMEGIASLAVQLTRIEGRLNPVQPENLPSDALSAILPENQCLPSDTTPASLAEKQDPPETSTALPGEVVFSQAPVQQLSEGGNKSVPKLACSTQKNKEKQSPDEPIGTNTLDHANPHVIGVEPLLAHVTLPARPFTSGPSGSQQSFPFFGQSSSPAAELTPVLPEPALPESLKEDEKLPISAAAEKPVPTATTLEIPPLNSPLSAVSQANPVFGEASTPKSRHSLPLNVAASPFGKYGNENVSPFARLAARPEKTKKILSQVTGDNSSLIAFKQSGTSPLRAVKSTANTTAPPSTTPMPSSTSRAPSLTKSEKTLFSPLEKSINNTNKAGCDEPPSTRPLLRGLPAPPSPIKSENSPFNQVPKEKPSFSPLLQYENLPLSPLPQSANSPFSPLEKQTPNNSTHKIGSDVPSDYLYPKPGVIFGQPTPPKSRKNMPLNVTGSPFAKYGNENSPFSQLGKQDKSPSQTGGACKFELPYKPISD